MSYNLVRSIEDFPGELPKLVKMSLKKNSMENLRGIECFPSLTYLKLSRNNISDIQELKRLSNLGNLKGISLYKNPLSEDKKVYTIAVLSACHQLESLDHNSCSDIRKRFEQEGLIDDLPRSEIIDDKDIPGDSVSGIIASTTAYRPSNTTGNSWMPKYPSPNLAQSSVSGDSSAFKNQKLAMVKGLTKQATKNSLARVASQDKSSLEYRDKIDAKDQDSKYEDAGDEDEDDTDKESRSPAAEDDDIFSLNPKVLATVKLAFDKKLKERVFVIGSVSKKDEEVWLGSPTHPIGYFKRISNNNYKVVGDGLWMLMASKTTTIKLIEEVNLNYLDII